MKIFLTGTFRTGSTLLAYMINQAGVPLKEETINFMRFYYRRYGQDLVARADALRIASDLDARLEQRFEMRFDVDAYAAALEAEGPGPYSYPFLYGLVMRLFYGGEDWGEKTVLEWRSAESLLEMFDDMKIVHIIRDPRDVLASWKKITIAPGTDYLDSIANCYDSMLHARAGAERFPGRYLVVRFEDLVGDPEGQCRALCAFMDREFSPDMMAVDKFKSKLGDKPWDPNVQTEFGDKLKGISKKPLGRWREHLPKEDVLLCEMVTGGLMEHFGYEPSGMGWELEDFFAVQDKLMHSPLAMNGLTAVRQLGQGVMRFPLNPLDSSTWGKVEQ